ncbi:MAG: hypothetical protein PHF60_00180 [Candidatus ainarchaeum sp.]|nr:hypothetical protein [Candidatus ainarchaeum sp.]
MAETYKKKEAVEKSLLPGVSRTSEELHGPIHTLGASAANFLLSAESTYVGGPKAIAKAGKDMDIAANVDKTRPIPVPERFRNMLTALR